MGRQEDNLVKALRDAGLVLHEVEKVEGARVFLRTSAGSQVVIKGAQLPVGTRREWHVGGKPIEYVKTFQGWKPAPSARPRSRPQEEHRQRLWVDRVPGLPESTKRHYTDAEGNYTPERQRLHKKIVDAAFEGKTGVPEGAAENPQAVLTMGGPASGKTSAAKNIVKGFGQYVHVDPDGVKEQIPEYQQAIKAGARNAAWMAHHESSDVAGQVLNRGADQRNHLFIDATGSDPDWHLDVMKNLKRIGYDVHLFMADVDPSEAAKRQEERAEETGRYVPPDVFHSIHQRVPQNYEVIAKEADNAVLLDNHSYPPRVVHSVRKDETGRSVEQTHDQDYMNKFNSRRRRMEGIYMREKKEQMEKETKKALGDGARVAVKPTLQKSKPYTTIEQLIECLQNAPPEPPREKKFSKDDGVHWPHDDLHLKVAIDGLDKIIEKKGL